MTDLVEGCPVLESGLELLKIQKFGHVFYSIFLCVILAIFCTILGLVHYGSDPFIL